MGWFWSDKKEQQEKEDQKQEEREKNIEIATRFLSNPKVKDVPRSQKVQFLKRKGLTQKDIEEAFNRHQENQKEKEKEGEKEKESKGDVVVSEG